MTSSALEVNPPAVPYGDECLASRETPVNANGTGPNEIGNESEFPDDAIDDDEVDPDEQLLLDRKELNELGLELDNPEGFADD
jgi:hypothetical protein